MSGTTTALFESRSPAVDSKFHLQCEADEVKDLAGIDQTIDLLEKTVTSERHTKQSVQEWMETLGGYVRGAQCRSTTVELEHFKKALIRQKNNLTGDSSQIHKNKLAALTSIASAALLMMQDGLNGEQQSIAVSLTVSSNLMKANSPHRADEIEAFIERQRKQTLARPVKVDDRLHREGFSSLHDLVFADGQVDADEKLLLNMMIHLARAAGLITTAISPLLFVHDGRELPAQGRLSFPYKDAWITLFENRGRVLQAGGTQQWEGYRKLSNDDPRVTNRRTDIQCFSFALSDSPNWEAGSDGQESFDGDYMSIVRRDYRNIFVPNESAQLGDLVVYFNYYGKDAQSKVQLGTQHMAIVSQVDENGKPTHVIGQHGFKGEIFEHPIDEAYIAYGAFYAVFRKK